MRKGMPQVAKNASKVAKSASKVGKKVPSWAHFGSSMLTFAALGAIFHLPWLIFAHR